MALGVPEYNADLKMMQGGTGAGTLAASSTLNDFAQQRFQTGWLCAAAVGLRGAADSS